MATRRKGKSVAKKRVQNKGLARVTKAADEEIDHHADEIVKSLREKATAGNATAARLLLDLAGDAEWTQKPEEVNRVLNLVQSWEEGSAHADADPERNTDVL